ncbi:MAG: ATP-binding protein [Acidimicrobiales bacterium]
MERVEQAGVTPREAEVLALLGQRLSNAEIGERLYISVRTVESHVSALLTKLGAVDRRALGKLAAASRTARPPLPRFRTSFVGRSAEIGALGQLLDLRRVVTLVGPPGVGKTRLALEVANARTDTRGTPTWFVDLAPLRAPVAPSAVSDLLVRALNAVPQAGQSLHDVLASVVGAAPSLLVVDNCEQVVEEAAGVVVELLAAADEVCVLATSREPLALADETVYDVEPLLVPTSDDVPSAAAAGASPAVQLFVERATAASARFELTATNAAAVATLCRRLDGLPLAIELAASRVRAFPTSELVAHLDQRFALLSGGARTADRRHRTLREAIDWSYEQLADDERELFDRLGVFPADFDFDAAAAVADVGGGRAAVVRLLPALVDKSLVATTGGEADRRYRLLESLRAYAIERLEGSGELGAARLRHRDWYHGLVERAAPELRGPHERTWLARFDEEYDNLLAALQSSLDDDDGERGVRTATHLSFYWWVRGRYAEGRRWLEQLVDASPGAPAGVRAEAWKGIGWLADDAGAYDVSSAAFERSLALSRELGDEMAIGKALNGLGNVSWKRGDFDEAIASWSEFLASCRRRSDEIGVATALNNLGLVVREQGRYAEAEALLVECCDTYSRLGSDQGVASALSNLGSIHLERGDYRRATDVLTEALEIRESIGQVQGIAKTLSTQAAIETARGRFAAADELYARIIEIGGESGDRQRIAYGICGRADVAHLCGDCERAIARYEEALAIFRKLCEPLGQANVLVGLASAAVAVGERAHGAACADEALEHYRHMGHRHGIAAAHHVLARIARLAGDEHRAADLDRNALLGFDELGCRLGVASCLEGLAEHHRRADPAESALLLAAAAATRDAIGAPVPPVDRPAIDAMVDALQADLGEEQFTARWREGRAAWLAEVLARAGRRLNT